jgi:type II secretory ATPase GspE/PulE/Tfp pilus assembly ATPase PilB-like protein
MAELAVKGRLGDRLVEKGLLSRDRLQVALAEQKRFHRPLGEILLSLGFLQEADITALLAEDFGLEFLRAADVQPDPLILAALDPGFVRETLAFPYRMEDGVLRVLVVDPADPAKASALRARFPFPLQLALTTEEDLLKLARTHLRSQHSEVAALFAGMDAESKGVSGDAFPVEQVVQAVLLDGIRRQATDIHIEPDERLTRVRYRVDGMLQGAENLPASATAAIVSRLKILAHLDISERRRPQDGRLRVSLDEHEVDMRVSILPTQHGENVVLRILSSAGLGVLRLASLGIGPELQAVLRGVGSRPHGLFLVTGPTGSGKTTTLYAMLAEVDAVHRKVATVEDPIEYRLPLLRQTQVDPAIGFGFAAGLRSLLRQDPDVILVGEIRDQETADMAIKASMTGHLVLSTLHTSSALGAVPRLVDMGLEPYLVIDALVGVLSQRLVRRVCAGCVESVAASARELAWLGAEGPLALKRGRGCPACDGSGFRGRTALLELFLPDPRTAEALRARVPICELEVLARELGFRSMEECGKRSVLAGTTTPEEVQRVTRAHFLTAEEREGRAS